MPIIRLETRVAAPIEQCFDLNLSIDVFPETMRASRLRPVAGVKSGITGPGGTTTWQATHFGVRFRLRSVILEYAKPYRFVDEQTKGPFKRWWHEHIFIDEGESTLVIDVIDFRAPFGPLGRLAEALVLTRYMRELIASRNRWLRERLEADAAAVDH